MRFLRSLIYSIALVLWTILFGLRYMPTLWQGDKERSNTVPIIWGRGAITLAKYICGIDWQVSGTEHKREGGAIYAVKHQSAWETFAFWLLVDKPIYILKEELLWVPIFGQYMKAADHIAIDRRAGARAMIHMLREGERYIKAQRNIVMFPEGTRTQPGETVEYKKGIANMYKRLDAPVVPVALNTGVFWPKKGFIKKSGTVQVQFLPAIEPGLAEDDFMNQLHESIETASLNMLPESMKLKGKQTL